MHGTAAAALGIEGSAENGGSPVRRRTAGDAVAHTRTGRGALRRVRHRAVIRNADTVF